MLVLWRARTIWRLRLSSLFPLHLSSLAGDASPLPPSDLSRRWLHDAYGSAALPQFDRFPLEKPLGGPLCRVLLSPSDVQSIPPRPRSREWPAAASADGGAAASCDPLTSDPSQGGNAADAGGARAALQTGGTPLGHGANATCRESEC
jgi:hypothetical protein